MGKHVDRQAVEQVTSIAGDVCSRAKASETVMESTVGWSLTHTKYLMTGWCGALISDCYVSITLWGPGEGVTPFPWSVVSAKFLGMVSVV